jgi:hypothetical protein
MGPSVADSLENPTVKPERPPYLYQQILLLMLNSNRGTPIQAQMHLAVAAAVLADWLMTGRIMIDQSRRQLVALEDARDSGDPVFDACLRVATASNGRVPLRTLIGRLSRIPRLRQQAADTLCSLGILRADRDLVLGLFPRQVYREVDPLPKKAIVDRMRTAIFSVTARTDAKIAMLIALAQGANLLWQIFGRREIRQRKARIEAVIGSNAGGDGLVRLSKTFRQAVAVGIAANSLVVG